MGRPRCTRAEDETLLSMLQMRRRVSSRNIAVMFGQTDTYVRIATNRVMQHDSLAEGRDLTDEYGFLTNSQANMVRHNAG